jgi:predicted dinucleotide-binding enzyme
MNDMQTQKTIAIIGATGIMGSALAKSLAKGNYRLLLFTEKKKGINGLVKEIKSIHPGADIESINCSYNASWEADIIIAAVPCHSEKTMADKIREVASQKIVISIANPPKENNDVLVTPTGSSAAEELQKLLPNSKVVKVFSTNFAADFSTPVIDGKQVDSFIAGDDAEALATVSELVRTAGFNPIIAGALPVSRTLENMQLHH